MVTLGQAYVLFVTAAALVALAAAIPVLLRIVADGRERWRRERRERRADDGEGSEDPPTDTPRSRCPYCGAENDDGYTYCRECLEQL